MRAAMVKRSLVILLLSIAKGEGSTLTFPKTISSPSSEYPSVLLTFDSMLILDPVTSQTQWTRAYNAEVPGPTIRTKPGKKLKIILENRLDQPNPDCKNKTDGQTKPFCLLNRTNLHTHGLHVSSETGQDNILYTYVSPGATFPYHYDIPEYHMGGTFWYHPHAHHATAVGAGGGAFGVLIVDDPVGSLPNDVAAMPDVVLFISMMNYVTIRNAAKQGEGYLWTSTDSSTDVALVNGQHQPTTHLDAGVWNRFRFVFAAINQAVDIVISSNSSAVCSLQLLAKDGIYLKTAPRTISHIPMWSGNRADVAIACSCPAGFSNCMAELWSVSSDPVDRSKLNDPAFPLDGIFNGLLLTLAVTGTASPTPLSAFNVRRPCYLVDLVKAGVPRKNVHMINSVGWGDGSWKYDWDGHGKDFTYTWPNPSEALADISVGKVYEWKVTGTVYHPFHVHVSPYQIVDWSNEIDTHHLLYNTTRGGKLLQNSADDNYFQRGDWHDTIVMPTSVTIRLQTDNFASPYVIHCHNLAHEDLGMLAFLNVTGESGQVWPGAEHVDPTCYRTAFIPLVSNAAGYFVGRTFMLMLVFGFDLSGSMRGYKI